MSPDTLVMCVAACGRGVVMWPRVCHAEARHLRAKLEAALRARRVAVRVRRAEEVVRHFDRELVGPQQVQNDGLEARLASVAVYGNIGSGGQHVQCALVAWVQTIWKCALASRMPPAHGLCSSATPSRRPMYRHRCRKVSCSAAGSSSPRIAYTQ